jgi:hypothetical protein
MKQRKLERGGPVVSALGDGESVKVAKGEERSAKGEAEMLQSARKVGDFAARLIAVPQQFVNLCTFQ